MGVTPKLLGKQCGMEISQLPSSYQDMLISYLTSSKYMQYSSEPLSIVNPYNGLLIQGTVIGYRDGELSWRTDDIIGIVNGQLPVSREMLLHAMSSRTCPQADWLLLGWNCDILPLSIRKRATAFMEKQLRRIEQQENKKTVIDEWLASDSKAEFIPRTLPHFDIEQSDFSEYDSNEFDDTTQWSIFINLFRKQAT